MAGKKSPREQREEILKKAAKDLEEINEMMEKWKAMDKLTEPYPLKKKRGGTVSRRKGSAVASKKRKKSIPYPRKFPDDPGAAHPDYEQKNPHLWGKDIKKIAKKGKRLWLRGTVKRKSGGKIMQGYKAGGKV